MRNRFITSTVAALALSWSVPAVACSPVLRPMTSDQVREYARDQFAKASLVIDAEVELPMNMATNGGQIPMALLRVITRYKGVEIVGHGIALVYATSCDIALLRKGERVRILLTEGPTVFRAEQFSQAPGTEREEALDEFNAEIDRLVGRARPRGFSAFPGAAEPPQ